ncbi:MAG TPA: hypothetical protein VHH57_07395 [Gaiella sp.]|jgi:hypothetical protein|nr:hypothetical protein [Gaiella sp.]
MPSRLRERDFRLLFTATTITTVGDRAIRAKRAVRAAAPASL